MISLLRSALLGVWGAVTLVFACAANDGSYGLEGAPAHLHWVIGNQHQRPDKYKILTGVFDPPPHLFAPWAYLAALGGVTCPAVVATVTSVIRARGPAADIMRDL